jgi:hypothetical protein
VGVELTAGLQPASIDMIKGWNTEQSLAEIGMQDKDRLT